MIRTSHRIILIALVFSMLHVASVKAQSENLQDSLRNAAEQLSYHPDSVDLRLKKASWNMLLEQWEYALDEYSLVLKHHPDCVAALFYRAYANQKLSRLSFARQDYENLLQIVPGHFEGRLGLALLDQQMNRKTDAMNQINLLVNQHPDSALAYAARAGIEQENGMLELAEYDFTEALRRDKDNIQYLLNRAQVRIQLRKLDEAKQDIALLQKLGIPKPQLDALFEKK